MNVLLYSGPGTERNLAYTRECLRKVLGEFYDVLYLTPAQLADEPWTENAAALVIPGGRDLPYVADLAGRPNARIRKWVEEGGRFLGICAGTSSDDHLRG